MRNFLAKFGETEITRQSEHGYQTAGAWVNQLTGEVKNPTFSKGRDPKPSIYGVFNLTKGVARLGVSPKKLAAYEAENKELKKVWLLQVVNCEEV